MEYIKNDFEVVFFINIFIQKGLCYKCEIGSGGGSNFFCQKDSSPARGGWGGIFQGTGYQRTDCMFKVELL